MTSFNKERMITSKDGRLYKFLDIFFDDDQKDSLIINFLIFFAVHAINIRFIRQLLDEYGEFESLTLIKSKINGQIFVLARDNSLDKIECLYRSKGFFSDWREINVPIEIESMLMSAKTKKDTRLALNKLIRLKAFW